MSNAMISNTSVRMIAPLNDGIGAVRTILSVLNLHGGNGVGLCQIPPVSGFSDGIDRLFVSLASLFEQRLDFKQRLRDGDRAYEVSSGRAGGTNAELLYHC